MLADRSDGTVVGAGSVVVKAHPPGTDPDTLRVRLYTAAHPLLAQVLLPPLALPPPAPAGAGPGQDPESPPLLRRLSGGRLATGWPRGTALAPDDDPGAVPWAAAGRLLARLHTVPTGELTDRLPGPMPAMAGPERAAQALSRLRTALDQHPPNAVHAGAAEAVEGAWATLPAWCRGEAPQPARSGTLCHGDFHFGQLVRHPGLLGPWRLIDVDDLGVGEPAWDLARPAAWFAAGLLPPGVWEGFLHAYATAGGTAVPAPEQAPQPYGEPSPEPAPERANSPTPPPLWPAVLDAPARALTAQSAAVAVAKAHLGRRALSDAEWACVESCSRIADTAAASANAPAPPASAEDVRARPTPAPPPRSGCATAQLPAVEGP